MNSKSPLISQTIERYSRKIILRGEKINKVFDHLNTLFDDPKQNSDSLTPKICFITGEGGSGKSEVLQALDTYLRPHISETEPQRSKDIERLKKIMSNKILYSGIIDLYRKDFHYGRRITREAFFGWKKYFDALDLCATKDYALKEVFESYTDAALPQKYKDFEDKYNSFVLTRQAVPGVVGTEHLIAQALVKLEDFFYEEYNDLIMQGFVPVILLDTAELLEQEDTSEEDEASSISWFINLISTKKLKEAEKKSEESEDGDKPAKPKKDLKGPEKSKEADSILVIAGRSKNDLNKEITLPLRSVRDNEFIKKNFEEKNPNIYQEFKQEITLRRFFQVLSHDQPNRKVVFDLGDSEERNFAFDETALKNYLCDYARNYYKIRESSPFSWEELVEKYLGFSLTATQNPSLNDLFNSSDYTGLAERLLQLTSGNPLLIEWLCQLLFNGNANFIANIIGGTLATLRENFYERLGTLLIDPNAWLYRRLVDRLRLENDTEQEAARAIAQHIFCYAFVARKGLDLPKVKFLIEQDCFVPVERKYHTLIKEYYNKNNLLNLVFNAFKTDPFLKVREESSNEGANTDRIFLHDLIAEKLEEPVIRRISFEAVKKIAATLVQVLRDPKGGSSSLREAELQMYNLQSGNLVKLNHPETKHYMEHNWYRERSKMLHFLELENKIQDRLLERMYYELVADFKKGYDEFSRIDLLAISEHEVGFDIRLKKEYVRYERKITQSKQGDARTTDRAEKDYQITKAFWEIRDAECKMRTSMRMMRDNINDKKALENLIALLSVTDSEENPENKSRLLLLKAYISNLLWGWSSKLESYNLEVKDIELKKLEELVDNIVKSTKDIEEVIYEDVRPYSSWFKYLTLGRLSHNIGYFYFVGGVAHTDYTKAILKFKQAIAYFKHAANRVQVFLDDTRYFLADVLLRSGQRSAALEYCSLALYSQREQGHINYIANLENLLARIYIASRDGVLQGYNLANSSVLLYSPEILETLKDAATSGTPFYHVDVLKIYQGQVLRKVARVYALSRIESTEIIEQSISILKEAKEAFSKNSAYYLLALNELGCAYRTELRIKQLNQKAGEPMQTGIHSLYNLAKGCFDDYAEFVSGGSKKENKIPINQWRGYIDNKLDQIQLDSYHLNYTPVQKEVLTDRFEKLIKELQDLKKSDVLSDGEKHRFYELEGKIFLRHADWTWKLYEDVNTASNESKQASILEKYIELNVKALDSFTKFQKRLLDGEGKEYTLDLIYINRLQEKLNHDLSHWNIRSKIWIYNYKPGKKVVAAEPVLLTVSRNMGENNVGIKFLCAILDIDWNQLRKVKPAKD